LVKLKSESEIPRKNPKDKPPHRLLRLSLTGLLSKIMIQATIANQSQNIVNIRYY